MAMARNHDRTLGVSPDVDEKGIRSAYRNLAKRYHPDAGDGSSAEAFRAIQDAYDVLSDPVKRREYDRECLARGPQPLHYAFRPAGVEWPVNHIDLRDLGRPGVPPTVRSGFRNPFEESDRLLQSLLEKLFFR
jgi:curved DNA-binding protein CbpA